MGNSFNPVWLSRKLTATLNDAVKEYRRWQEDDWALQAKKGSEKITKNRFVDSDYEKNALEVIYFARDRALTLIDGEMETARRALVAAPNGDEAAYIAAIAGRSDLTRQEYEAAMSTYTGHVAQKAITAAARRSGAVSNPLVSTPTETEVYLDSLSSLRDSVDGLYIPANFTDLTPGKIRLHCAEYEAFSSGKGYDAVQVLMSAGTPFGDTGNDE